MLFMCPTQSHDICFYFLDLFTFFLYHSGQKAVTVTVQFNGQDENNIQVEYFKYESIILAVIL